MISYQAVLEQLEKQLHEAKKASNEQQMRECVTAVRALCDVVLARPVEKSQTQYTQPPQMPPQQFVTTDKVEEEDGANGDSLFDF